LPVVDNPKVLAIVLITKKGFCRLRKFPQPYAFEPTSASVNYHDDADSESTGPTPTMGSRDCSPANGEN